MADPRSRLRLAAGLALVAGIALVVVAGLRLHGVQPPAFRGTPYHDDIPAPALALTAHDGRRVTLEDFRGRPVLLFFGYTRCPDICPLTLGRLARLRRELGGAAAETEILLVTMDPARDTPRVLGEYVRRFGPGVTGLTGDSLALDRAYAGYGATVLPPPPPVPAGVAGHEAHDPHAGHGASSSGTAEKPAGRISHTAPVYGIDRAGRLRVIISEAATEEETRDDIRTLARL